MVNIFYHDVLIPIMPKEMVGFGINVKCFVALGNFFKPVFDLRGFDKAIASSREDECWQGKGGCEGVAFFDEVAEFHQKPHAEIVDVVRLVAQGILINLIPR